MRYECCIMLAYLNYKTLLLNINFKAVFRTQMNIYGATFLLRIARGKVLPVGVRVRVSFRIRGEGNFSRRKLSWNREIHFSILVEIEIYYSIINLLGHEQICLMRVIEHVL